MEKSLMSRQRKEEQQQKLEKERRWHAVYRQPKEQDNTDEEEQKPIYKKQKLPKKTDEQWFNDLRKGIIPHSWCPHGIRMYCSEMINDCYGCIVEMRKPSIILEVEEPEDYKIVDYSGWGIEPGQVMEWDEQGNW